MTFCNRSKLNITVAGNIKMILIGLNNITRRIYILLVSAIIIGTIGCSKDKATPIRVVSNCKIYNQLPDDIQQPLNVNYSNKAILMGITTKRLYKNRLLEISYYWKLQEELIPQHRIFVHFTDKDNKALLQNDHYFCQNLPFKELRNKFIKETYVVDMPGSALREGIFIKIGIYVPEIAPPNRLKIISAEEISLDEDDTRAIIYEQ
jgi:hypothetical protein